LEGGIAKNWVRVEPSEVGDQEIRDAALEAGQSSPSVDAMASDLAGTRWSCCGFWN
jgi:hypothetical protein